MSDLPPISREQKEPSNFLPRSADWQTLLAEGTQAAWEEVSRRIHHIATEIIHCWHITLIVVDELSCEVLYKLVRHQRTAIAGFIKCASPDLQTAYARSIVIRSAVDLLRQHYRRRDKETLFTDASQIIDTDVCSSDNYGFEHLISILPEQDRILLKMRFLEGMRVGEIALKQKRSYSSVAVRIHRVLKRLRRIIEKKRKIFLLV